MVDGGNGPGGAELRETCPEDESAPIPGLEGAGLSGQAGDGSFDDANELPGALSGRYKVVEALPGGQQARVFRVRSTRGRGPEQVVKLYHRGTTERRNVLRKLRKYVPPLPHILQPVDVGREGGRLYEVQEYAVGGSLTDLIRAGMDERAVRTVVTQLVEALNSLHSRGIAHQDLKPSNVLLRRNPAESLDVALADFGASALPASGIPEGPVTCAYAPPEAFAAQADARPGGSAGPDPVGAADCWAMGMLAAEMLTGKHPLLDTPQLQTGKDVGNHLLTSDLDALVTGVEDASWRALCQGLLRRNPSERWTVAKVRTWLLDPKDAELQPSARRAGFRFVGEEYAAPAELAEALAHHWQNAVDLCRNTRSYDGLRHWVLHELGARDVAERLPDFDRETPDDVQVFHVVRALDADRHCFRGMELTLDSVAQLARAAATDPGGETGEALRTLHEGGVLTAAGETNTSLGSVAAAWTSAESEYAPFRKQYPSLPELSAEDLTWVLAASTEGSGVLAAMRDRVRDVLRTQSLAPLCRWFGKLGGLSDAGAPALLAMMYLARQAHEDVTGDRAREKARAAEVRRAVLTGAALGTVVGGVAAGVYLLLALAALGWPVAFGIGFFVGLGLAIVASLGSSEGAEPGAGRALFAGVVGGGFAVAWTWAVGSSYEYLLGWLPDSLLTPVTVGAYVVSGAVLGLIGAHPEVRRTLPGLGWRNGAIASLLLAVTVSNGIVAAGALLPSRGGAVAEGEGGAPPPPGVLRDCPSCPVLMIVPAGGFRMGSEEADGESYRNERPAHTVDVPSFAMGQSEVTRAEYAAFTEATGRSEGDGCWTYDPSDRRRVLDADASWAAPGFTQEDAHPVVCVSWDDAQAYVRWLGDETGEGYRLPSEAEWEYAARAGTMTRWAWGDDRTGQCRHANGVDRSARERFRDWGGVACDDGAAATAAVRSFAANRFGLYDMAGNVWEWVADCWHAGYADAPRDGSAWTQDGDCAERVLRGGSWADDPGHLRSAVRGREPTDLREIAVGFRVARAVE